MFIRLSPSKCSVWPIINLMSSQTGFLVQQRYVLGLMIFVIYAMSAVYRSGFPLILTQMVYIPNSGSNSSSTDSNGELICPIRHSTPKSETTTTSLSVNILSTKNWILFACLFNFNENAFLNQDWWHWQSLSVVARVSGYNFVIDVLGKYLIENSRWTIF